MTVEGVRYGAIETAIDRQQGGNVWLTMSLSEGKNREIRKVLEAIGLRVSRLIRVAYGPFQLGRLEPGEVEEVPGKILADQLGLDKKDVHVPRAKELAGRANATSGPAFGPDATLKRPAAKTPMPKAYRVEQPNPVARAAKNQQAAKFGGGKPSAKPMSPKPAGTKPSVKKPAAKKPNADRRR